MEVRTASSIAIVQPVLDERKNGSTQSTNAQIQAMLIYQSTPRVDAVYQSGPHQLRREMGISGSVVLLVGHSEVGDVRCLMRGDVACESCWG